jgi:hypothetical protein
MVFGPPVNQQKTNGERDDAKDHQQRHRVTTTQECPTPAIHRELSDERKGQDNACRGFLTGGDWLGLAR